MCVYKINISHVYDNKALFFSKTNIPDSWYNIVSTLQYCSIPVSLCPSDQPEYIAHTTQRPTQTELEVAWEYPIDTDRRHETINTLSER